MMEVPSNSFNVETPIGRSCMNVLRYAQNCTDLQSLPISGEVRVMSLCVCTCVCVCVCVHVYVCVHVCVYIGVAIGGAGGPKLPHFFRKGAKPPHFIIKLYK